MDLHWQWRAWRDFDADTLHALLKLRGDVFVVEQNCAYADIDGLDPQCEHLAGYDGAGRLAACLRVLPPGVKYESPSIGRVVVAAHARRHGLARAAMTQAIQHCRVCFAGQPIVISAQKYLEDFYRSLGFATTSKPYLEDGILHVDMRLDPDRKGAGA